jgi:hypothetical protein
MVAEKKKGGQKRAAKRGRPKEGGQKRAAKRGRPKEGGQKRAAKKGRPKKGGQKRAKGQKTIGIGYRCPCPFFFFALKPKVLPGKFFF